MHLPLLESYPLQPVIGVIEFFIAVIAMLIAYGIAYAVRPFVQALASILRGIPWIGGDLAQWVEDRVEDFVNYVWNFINQRWNTVTGTWTQQTNSTANTSRDAAVSVRTTQEQIVGALNSVTAHVAQLVGGAGTSPITIAVTAIDERVNALILQDYELATGYARDLYVAATNWAYSDVQSLYNDITDTDNNVATLATNINDEIQTEHTNMVDYIQQVQDYAVNTAEQFATDAIGVTNSNIAFVDDQLNQRITNERQETDIQVQNLGDAINMNRDAITTFIQTQVLPRVADIEKFDEECAKPTCDNLLGFARLFGIGKNLLSDALLIEWLASLYAGGEGYNQQVVNDVKGFFGGPRDIIQQIIGR